MTECIGRQKCGNHIIFKGVDVIIYDNVEIGFMTHYKERKNQKVVITPAHQHVKNIWEMVYYVNNGGVFILGDKKIPYEKNTVMLIPPNIMHYEFSDSSIELYFIMFRPVFDHNSNGFSVRDYNNHFFENMFAQCFYLKNTKPINWQSNLGMVLGCVEQYMASLENIGEISIAEQLKQKISERFTDSSLQIGALLEEMPLSAWYQRKLFKEATGMTLTQYLNKIRIDYACSLLANSAMPIKSIAISSGFEDSYYFSRLFKTLKGSNPMLWRKEHWKLRLNQDGQ